jgi:acetylornithine deacetylase
VLDDVRAILDRLASRDSTFQARAHTMFGRPAYEIAADHHVPATLSASLAALGRAPRLIGASFWADSAVLGHAGIPAVLFGPGGAGLHSTEEYVNVSDVLLCRDALVDLIGRFCEAPRTGL